MDDHFIEEEDLVVANVTDRNWKGIIIAVLVISSVLALIVTSVVLLTPPDEGPRVKGRRFELEDIFSPDFQPLRLNGSWISDREWVFRDGHGGVSVLDVTTGVTKELISNHTIGRFTAVSFSVSSNKKYALLCHDVKKIHRYSFQAKYTVYDINSTDAKPLSLGDRHSGSSGRGHSILQLVKWGPDGNSLVMVHQGDIYYKAHPLDTTALRLTDSARPGVIYNGVPDWLYEEEILASNSALWFSSDGQMLLYLTFNDSLVGEHHMLQYGTPDEPFQYPQVRTLRYPQPGTNNPIVTATVCDLKQGNRLGKKQLQPPEGIALQDHYIAAAGWAKPTDVALVWTSRSYNVSIISVCSVKNGNCEEEYRIASERRGWVNNVPFPVFTTEPSQKKFITIAPIRDGQNGFFDHLVLVFMDSAYKTSHPLTHGNYNVLKFNAWDEERRLVYYTATPADHPYERRFYRVRVEQPYTEQIPDCLSCTSVAHPTVSSKNGVANGSRTTGQVLSEETFSRNTSSLSGDQDLPVLSKDRKVLRSNKSCSFVTSVRFNPVKTYLILECGGSEIPYVALYSASPDASNLRLIQLLQNNDALLNLSRNMAFPQVRTFPVLLTSGQSAQVRLLLPPGLREDEITQYPLILNVYGGPGTQLAVDRWGVDFATYLASKKDFIVAQIDGRGSGGKGWDYQHQVYYNLGHLEAEDQIEVTKYLRDSLPYVEANKIGIFGWSYGAYLTALIMTNKDKINLFQCGASIAPVSKWSLYDSAYTERYMGTPNVTDNFKGYSNSDITRNVENIDNKMFYLIHGTGDDNVHIQHSMLLAKALVDKKILFRQQIYPDEKHNLNGAKIHVHRSLEEFFEDCYKKQIPPEVGTGLNKGGKFDDFD